MDQWDARARCRIPRPSAVRGVSSPDRSVRVLVVYKKSRYRIYVLERKNRRMSELLRRDDPSVDAMRDTHETHERTLARTLAALRDGGAEVTARYRAQAAGDSYDLVVTVGGDGTLLEAARAITDTPVLAVNSAPSSSVGFFCGASPVDLEDRLGLALEGRLPVVRLARAQALVDGVLTGPPILNDVLFCHPNPAVTSRYILHVGRRRERQKSSGMWIGTPAGSSAAQRSAGGRLLPIASRQIQWIVREPYSPLDAPPVALVRGTIGPRGAVRIVNQMREAKLYLDGSHRYVELEMGQVVEMRLHRSPLRLVGFRGR